MDVMLSGGDCGGEVLHLDEEPANGAILTKTSGDQVLTYRYDGNGVAVFTGLQP